MIPQETIQQIQNRIDIIEIVGGFVKLKKRGANYLGLCPFHNEKSPSFTVSPSKEIYKCFGCGKSGNTISFLMEHEKYSYVEALKWLATKYNIEIEETFANPEQRLQQQTAESLFIVNKFAQEFFANILFNEQEGITAGLGYLKERDFREETIHKFQLGYCPENGQAFSQAAQKQQYNPELLVKSGLVVNRDERLVDNYRGRVLFPIHNQSGKVIGFGARLIRKNDRAPKYINTPENEIYVKSKLLYGMYFARQAIDKQNECLLVEGYTDVISLHQAGIENVVASGGTSLTVDQLRLIRKYTHNLTIIYDGDAAGVKAAMRGLDLALEEGLNVNLVLIPDNDDPDSYVKKIGATAFQDYITKNRKDVILFQLEVALKDAGTDSSKKSAVVNQIAESIARVNKTEDFTRQQDYIKRSAQLMKIDEEGLTALVNKHIRERIQTEEKKQQYQQSPVEEYIPEDPGAEDLNDLLSPDEKQEHAMVRALMEFGTRPWDESITVADHVFTEIEENGLTEMIDNKQLVRMIDVYKEMYQKGEDPGPKSFLYHPDQQLNQIAVSLMDNSNFEISHHWKTSFDRHTPSRDELYREEVMSCMNYLKLRKIKRLIAENQRDMERSTSAEEQLNLIEVHQHLKELEIQLARNIGTVIIK
ncbi:MAG: DNA primase [Sphingobacteriales bacterium]|nr:MAG: DNA primase [Sphingobacteriales bacterium]